MLRTLFSNRTWRPKPENEFGRLGQPTLKSNSDVFSRPESIELSMTFPSAFVTSHLSSFVANALGWVTTRSAAVPFEKNKRFLRAPFGCVYSSRYRSDIRHGPCECARTTRSRADNSRLSQTKTLSVAFTLQSYTTAGR